MNRRSLLIGSVPLLLAGCLNADRRGENGAGGEINERGNIEVVVDGSQFDLSQDRFQSEYADNESIAFHLHESDDHWYMEGQQRVTVAEGIDHIPHFEYSQDDGNRRLTVDETEYDDREPDTEILFFVDGDDVDPTEYELEDGDALRVEITTE